MFSVPVSVQITLKFYWYLSHSIQINKAAINLYARDLSFSVVRYLEKQKQNVTKVLIGKKEEKAPPLIFDSPHFRLPYLFLSFDHLPVNPSLETSKKELCSHDTNTKLAALNRYSNQIRKETYLA